MSEPGHEGKRSLKVPRDNNTFLCIPSAGNTGDLLRQNKESLFDGSSAAWVRPLQKLARSQTVEAARKYTGSYSADGTNHFNSDRESLVVGGHQPELFHPGVWFKNILLSKIAASSSSNGLNVIIDHDMARSDSIRVPARSDQSKASLEHGIGYERGELYQKSISLPMRLDHHVRVPWHLSSTRRSGLSGGEGERGWRETVEEMVEALRSCGLTQPIIEARFGLLMECIAKCDNFGDAFSQFRHRIEIDHGICNLEVPLGRLCEGTAFGFFVLQCVSDADTLWNAYNRCRSEYRQRNSIHNQAQPVPELAKHELSAQQWALELPFWIYGNEVKAFQDRKRLWLVVDADQSSEDSSRDSLLVDHPEVGQRTIERRLPKDRDQLAQVWQKWVEEGICIRPRALMTTLYLRCFVSDLFVHGIGGGAYDELTDAIIKVWLHMEPPQYITCSASLHLGIEPEESVADLELARTQRELQLMRSVPERFLDRSQGDQKLLYEQHSRLLSHIPERGMKRGWHAEMVRFKSQIESAISVQRRASLSNLQTLYRKLQQDKIQNSREFSFCLYSESDVMPRLQELANQASRP